MRCHIEPTVHWIMNVSWLQTLYLINQHHLKVWCDICWIKIFETALLFDIVPQATIYAQKCFIHQWIHILPLYFYQSYELKSTDSNSWSPLQLILVCNAYFFKIQKNKVPLLLNYPVSLRNTFYWSEMSCKWYYFGGKTLWLKEKQTQ